MFRSDAIRVFLRACCFLALGAALALALAGTRCAAQSSPSRMGWDALAGNQRAEARADFQAALKQRPGDAAALDGLGLMEDESDDETSALGHWRALYRLAPTSWQAMADWPGFVQEAQDAARWDLLDGAARDILASNASEPLKASAQEVQRDALLRAGRFPSAQAARAALGYLRDWQVIGPFDNVSKSGFARRDAPEQGIDLSASVVGKDDLVLRWHKLAPIAADDTCEVSDALSDGEPGVYYAATTVVSPAARQAALRYDPGSATRVFVNGALLVSDDIQRAPQAFVADPFMIPVTLRAGRNVILIKLATVRPQSASFSLRLTTPEGAPLRLATDAAHVAASVAQDGTPQTNPEPLAVSLVRSQPDGLERTSSLMDLLSRTGDYQAAEDEARKAIASLPKCGILHWQLSQVLSQDDQDNEAKSERETALADDPGNLSAQVDALTDLGASLPSPEYIQRLKTLRAAHPKSVQVLWALAAALNDAKLTEASLSAARAAAMLERGADAYSRLAGDYNDAGREPDRKAALVQGLAYSPNVPELVDKLADLDSDLDDPHGAIAEYELELTLAGESAYLRSSLADLDVSIKRPDLAIANLLRARQDRPQNAEICSQLSDLYQAQGKTPRALALLKEAVRLDPAQVALRDKLQVFSGAKPVIDLAAPVSSASALAADVGDAKDAPGVYFLDEGREVVYPDGATLVRFHQVVRVLDAAGVSRFQDFPLAIPTSTARMTVESARVTSAKGKVEDDTDSAERESISFPSLAPGDTIDITYRVEDYQKGALAHQFWAQWFFQTGSEMPSKRSRFVLITPPDMSFQTQAHGDVPQPATRDVNGWRIREWNMADLPAVKHALSGVPSVDCGTWLDISSVPSWKTVVQWYQGLSQTCCEPDAAIRAKAAELTAGCATDREKMRAIVAYVARDIQYQSTPFRLSAYIPTEGKQVIREQYGDCKDKAALLTALLACVGIKSEMVLLSPRDHGITPYLPSPRFNHAIAYVQAPDGPEFVDATADQLGFGLLPSADQQVPALVIDDRTTDLTLTPLSPVEQNKMVETHVLALDEDGTLHGELTMSMQGQWGWYMRSALKEIPVARRDEMARYMITKLVPSSVFESGTLADTDHQDLPLIIHIKYHADNYGSRAGNFLLAKLPWAGQNQDTSQFSDPARTQDIETASERGDYLSTMDLTLPAGYVPQDLEMDEKIASDWGSYEVHYTLANGVLHGTREVKLTAVRVMQKDIPAYVAFLKAVGEDENKQLVLRKAAVL